MIMNLSIREWRIGDKTALAQNLNNPKVLNNLRDGLPYPYTEKDAEVTMKEERLRSKVRCPVTGE